MFNYNNYNSRGKYICNKLKLFFLMFLGLGLICASSFALPLSLSKNIEAFRKYEPDFVNSIHQIEDIIRKIQSKKGDLDKNIFFQYKEKLFLLNNFVQKRYNLLDDLYKTSLSDYPNYKEEIIISFSKIEELYQKFSAVYNKAINVLQLSSKNIFAPQELQASESINLESIENASITQNGGHINKNVHNTTALSNLVETIDNTYTNKIHSVNLSSDANDKKLKISGSFKIGLTNRNEKYSSQDLTLPNNYNIYNLTLSKQLSSKNNLAIDEKFIHRKRNEIVNENHFNLAFMHEYSKNTNLIIRNKLTNLWYPQNSSKSYRNNLAEISIDKKLKKYEEFYTFGYETQIYPNFTRSDFTQKNFNYQYTFFIPNGTFYAESSSNYRKYKHSSDLDYKDFNFLVEFNRHYDGNNCDISITDNYTQRLYENESLALFRTSYCENYYRFYYYIPVNKTWQWTFEHEYLIRDYFIDEPRGYKQLKFKTTGNIEIDNKSRAKIKHEYIFNDENTRSKSHKNHIWFASYEKKLNDKVSIKLEDNYHLRYSLDSGIMNFKENTVNLQNSYKISKFIDVVLKFEYLLRLYLEHYYRDFKILTTVLQFNLSNNSNIIATLDIGKRKFEHRNGNYIATDWNNEDQPMAVCNISYKLSKDKRLKFKYSYEKTFYKSFDTESQELLWDFTKPMVITEFYGGVEYYF